MLNMIAKNSVEAQRCSGVSVVDFEEVNFCWDIIIIIFITIIIMLLLILLLLLIV